MVRPEKTVIYPLQVLVNYWATKPAKLGIKLNLLRRQGISHVATFVPWQAAEADVTHSLHRFLQAIVDRGMTVSLIVTPEVGVDHLNSGLPKDLFSKPDILAKNSDESLAISALPPNFFALPSLESPEFQKRYQQYLVRLDGILGDLARTQPKLFESIQVILTGSFWKYYRSPQTMSDDSFNGVSGDCSLSSELAYRHYRDGLFLQKDCNSQLSTSKFKTQEFEPIHRQAYAQYAEESFRLRTLRALRKKALGLNLLQAELFTPEADPAYLYSQTLQYVTAIRPDFPTLDRLITESCIRQSYVEEQQTTPLLHWTSLGGFADLSDSEKQFLLLKSLLLFGGEGGSVLLDESEWLELSPHFKNRLEVFSRTLSHQELKRETRALCLVPHLWSNNTGKKASFWSKIKTVLGSHARLVSSFDALDSQKECSLLFVEPSFLLTSDRVQKVQKWVDQGKTAVINLQTPMTDAARDLVNKLTTNAKPLQITLGAHYQIVQSEQAGQWVLWDGNDQSTDWQRFLNSILGLSKIHRDVRWSDPHADLVQLDRGGGKAGVFVFNGTRKTLAVELTFEYEVGIGDLATILSEKTHASEDEAHAKKFEIEVPPCGVLPFAVSGLGEEGREKLEAEKTSGLTLRHAESAATSELSGFSMADDMGKELGVI